ncbi:hypothetical protein [uncultured Pseudoteredinibacter sp.]|uniref:hypothetical protein n=1 Tax=uncultured Pseudoteredinibacter sp. TaxID=1641701 RepID=UPI0026080DB5|nr:hypothetical protein [uncultured Pseudoteredinibacter sp.]
MVWLAGVIVLVLFLIFPKKMAVIAGVLALLGGVSLAVVFYPEWRDDRAKEKVEVSVKYLPRECGEHREAQLESALTNAVKAGDTDAAQRLASVLRARQFDNSRESMPQEANPFDQFDESAEREAYPLLIEIKNMSNRKVLKVVWRLSITKPGRSTDLVEEAYQDYSSDLILAHREGFRWCYRIPRLSETGLSYSELEYKIKSKWVTFE